MAKPKAGSKTYKGPVHEAFGRDIMNFIKSINAAAGGKKRNLVAEGRAAHAKRLVAMKTAKHKGDVALNQALLAGKKGAAAKGAARQAAMKADRGFRAASNKFDSAKTTRKRVAKKASTRSRARAK